MTTRKFGRTLLVSVLALAIVLSVTGGTIAWFTDEVTSANNVIASGTLDIELSYKNPTDTTWTIVEDGSAPLFNYDKWEPGYTQYKYVQIENKGTLALKFDLNIKAPIDTEAKYNLADVIDVYTGTAAPTRDNLGTNVGTLSALMQDGDGAAHGELLAGKKVEMCLVLKMQESAGNEYQGLSVGDGFALELRATQLTHESDSFGSDYDKDAEYDESAYITEGDDLLTRLAKATPGQPLTLVLMNDVEWPTEGHHGENDVTPASSVTIDGQGKYKLTATGSGVTPIGDTEAPFTLKNLTVVDESKSYNESAWELGYLEMGGPQLTCENVTFQDPIMVEGEKAAFTNCTFTGKTTEMTMYGVWMYNGDATFTNCTFNGTRGMKICDQYAGEVGTVVVDGCTFNSLTEKPGVAIDDQDTRNMKITIKNSIFIDCQAGDQGYYIYETDNTEPTLENNNTVLSRVEIGTADELFAFAKDVNENNNSYSDKLVLLTADIDLQNAAWTPIGQTGATTFDGIFDGQNHTISNLNVDSSAQTGADYSSGLFGWVESHSVNHGHIKNVKIDGATIKGHHNCGALVGYITADNALVENCHVTNATIECTNANADANGDKAGALIGNATVDTPVKNCSASNSTVSAGRDAGQVVGAGNVANVTGCTATNVTVSHNGGSTGDNIRNEVIGREL